MWSPCHALHIQSEILLLDDLCGTYHSHLLVWYPSHHSVLAQTPYFDFNVECTIEIKEKAPDTICVHIELFAFLHIIQTITLDVILFRGVSIYCDKNVIKWVSCK